MHRVSRCSRENTLCDNLLGNWLIAVLSLSPTPKFVTCAARVPYSVCCLQTEFFFLFPHFTKPDRKIRLAFRNSVFPKKKSDHFVTFLSKTLSPTDGNHGSILSCPLRQSVVRCRFLSHTVWVRDKVNYVGYASIQCVSVRDGERRNHPD